MSTIHDYGLFLFASVIVNLTPGQDTLYILGRSLGGGRRAGTAAALGIGVGSVCHTLAAAVGLSALLVASPKAFMAVKLAGAGYLIWIGIGLIRSKTVALPLETSASSDGRSLYGIFFQGLLTNALNPKVALFYLSFLPQFIAADTGSKSTALLALGLSFVATGTLWGLLLVRLADLFQAIFLRRPNLHARLDGAFGLLLMGLGVHVLLSQI